MNKKLIGYGALLLVLGIAAGYGGSMLMHTKVQSQRPTVATPSAPVTNQAMPSEPTVPQITEPTPPTDLGAGSIAFTPLKPSRVQLASLSGLFGPGPLEGMSVEAYKVGTITAGPYTGGDLLLVTAAFDGPGVGYSVYHFINQNTKYTYLAKDSAELFDNDGFNRSGFLVDTASVLTSLSFPTQISYRNSTFTLVNGSNNSGELFDNEYKAPNYKVAFNDPTLGDIYMDAANSGSTDRFMQNGFYVKAPDGTTRTYTLDISFYDKDHNLPSVTWEDGTKNAVEYVSVDRGGCGSSNYLSVVTGVAMGDLVPAGHALNGNVVYQLKDSNSTLLKDIYTNDYNPYDAPKLSYADFIKARPVFFWYDLFGRLVKFQRADFIPQAECGKPVIYLYPQKTTTVSVQINPQGGLTKSEPAYNFGWKVVATPDSKLTDTKTGKTYPYLFWEGRGGIYVTPSKGFMVAAKDIHTLLLDKLAELGLNKKEASDFIEFWEPRMTGAPYFFVTFLGNQEMNAIAPLTIDPKPDSVIRVLMDFAPLQKPIAVESYDIKTPVRSGFTVVEWGGVLR